MPNEAGPCVLSSKFEVDPKTVEESLVLSKSSFFFALLQHFGGRIGGGSKQEAEESVDCRRGMFYNPDK